MLGLSCMNSCVHKCGYACVRTRARARVSVPVHAIIFSTKCYRKFLSQEPHVRYSVVDLTQQIFQVFAGNPERHKMNRTIKSKMFTRSRARVRTGPPTLSEHQQPERLHRRRYHLKPKPNCYLNQIIFKSLTMFIEFAVLNERRHTVGHFLRFFS